MAAPIILIVDDQERVRQTVADYLTLKGMKCVEASSLREGEEKFRMERPAVAIIDYALPDGDALQLLPRLKAIDPSTPVLILTGHASVDLAVKSIKEGAETFLTKPVELPALGVLVSKLVETDRFRKKERASTALHQQVDPFIGTSPAITALREQAQRIAESDSVLLIQGETGSGKGVLARWLHENGPRRDETFVDLNCAGLKPELLESELFGHERGAFTGAVATKTGLLEVAHRGTLFLDEIGDMDMQVQPKLLKVLEEKRLRRIGDVRERRIDIRLIAASHRQLGKLVAEGAFRSDLFFRVSTIPLVVPPLRERREDLEPLVERLSTSIAHDMGRVMPRFSGEALAAMRTYAWPGNIRELRNVIERVVLLDGGGEVRARDLHLQNDTGTPVAAVGEIVTLEEMERRYINAVLQHHEGNVENAARSLGLSRSAMYDRLRKLRRADSR
jgi:DNA-binding NtrC family response regulator